MTIVIFIIVLAVLILVHEFGHFIAAKKSGIRVDEFGLGFPPKLFSVRPKESETEYSLNAIPFGGFVKIFGEDHEEVTEDHPDYTRSFVNKPKWKQAVVLSAGVIGNILLAVVLYWATFMMGMPTAISGTDDVSARAISDPQLVVTQVLPDSPADRAGLAGGSRIVSVTTPTEMLTEDDLTVEAVTSAIRAAQDNEVVFSVSEDGETRDITVVPERDVVEEDVYAVGIGMARIARVAYPIHVALAKALSFTGELLGAIVVGIAGLIAGLFAGTADLAGVAGPVGIANLVGTASSLGVANLLSFVAFISLNLAVLNLIPFPALDGGRLLFLLIEKIKGSPINPKVARVTNTVGFALLILLMLVVTYNDIVRLF